MSNTQDMNIKGETSVKVSGQAPGGNSSISIGGGYGGDGNTQFFATKAPTQSKLKAPTKISSPQVAAPKIASPTVAEKAAAAKIFKETLTPNRRHNAAYIAKYKAASGMVDSLNIAGENTFLKAAKKGYNVDDIEGKLKH